MNWDIFLEYYKKYQKMQIWLRSESLSFYSILVIIPVIGSVFWIINQLPGATQRSLEVKNLLLNHFSLQHNSELIGVFDKIISSLQSSNLSYALLFIFIFSFHKLILKFSQNINYILKIKSPAVELSSNYVFLLLRRSSLVIFIPIVFIVTSIITVTFNSYLPEFLSEYLALLANFIIGTIVFFFIYLFASTQSVTAKSAFRASIVVIIAIEILKKVFLVLNKYMFTSTEIYGVFAAIPFTLLWLQTTWVVILFGAVLLKKKKRLKSEVSKNEVLRKGN